MPSLSSSAPPTAPSGVLVVIRPERHLRSVATDMLTLAMWIKVLAELVVVVASLDGVRDDVVSYMTLRVITSLNVLQSYSSHY
jgi:hypothetical protein